MKKYMMLLLVSAVLVAPACSRNNKAQLMAGAVVSGVAGAVHFLGHRLGIKRHRPAPSDGAEARANSYPKKDLINTVK